MDELHQWAPPSKEYQQPELYDSTASYCDPTVYKEEMPHPGTNSSDVSRYDGSSRLARPSSWNDFRSCSQVAPVDHSTSQGSTLRSSQDGKTRAKQRMLRKRESEKRRRNRLSSAFVRLVQVLFRVDPDFKRILNARSQRHGIGSSGCNKLLESMRSSSGGTLGSEGKRQISYLFSQHELLEQATNALQRLSEAQIRCKEAQNEKPPAKAAIVTPFPSERDVQQAAWLSPSLTNHTETLPEEKELFDTRCHAVSESIAPSSSNMLDSSSLLALMCERGQQITNPITTTPRSLLLPPRNKPTGLLLNPGMAGNLIGARLPRYEVSQQIDRPDVRLMLGLAESRATHGHNTIQSPTHRYSYSHQFWSG